MRTTNKHILQLARHENNLLNCLSIHFNIYKLGYIVYLIESSALIVYNDFIFAYRTKHQNKTNKHFCHMFPFGDNYQLLLVYCHCLSEIIGIGIAICLQSRSVIGDKTNNQFREELIAYVVQSTVYKALLIFPFESMFG